MSHRNNLTASNISFEYNYCTRDGGAIKAYLHSSLHITNSLFHINKAQESNGGAIFLENQCNMTTESTEFIQNSAASGGGAIMVLDNSEYNDSGSFFHRNSASDNGKLVKYDI